MTSLLLRILGYQKPRNAIIREREQLSQWAKRMADIEDKAANLISEEKPSSNRIASEAKLK